VYVQSQGKVSLFIKKIRAAFVLPELQQMNCKVCKRTVSLRLAEFINLRFRHPGREPFFAATFRAYLVFSHSFSSRSLSIRSKRRAIIINTPIITPATISSSKLISYSSASLNFFALYRISSIYLEATSKTSAK